MSFLTQELERKWSGGASFLYRKSVSTNQGIRSDFEKRHNSYGILEGSPSADTDYKMKQTFQIWVFESGVD